ncbi:MAG: helix-turn-helix domain-containing protein [Phaeodactylibacter sp.]|nr:helix-turn-helix domain-containing protein [Phaeodactylibacter sp.]
MKKHHIRLTVEDKTKLNRLIAGGKLKPRGAKRAAALLALDEGKLYKEVAAELGVTSTTVSAWAQKYEEKGLGFLKDKHRTGRPRRITSRQKNKIVALAQSEPPQGHERWSLRLLAEKAIALGYVDSISHQYINQILKENELSIY